ncbi:MAG: hypothetical protein QW814_00245 [Methanothrix sp.]
MSFFGIMVFVSLMFVAIIATHIAMLSSMNSSILSNTAAYENIANMETFTSSFSGFISQASNCSEAFVQILQAGKLDGINATLSGDSIVLRTYSKPFAVAIVACGNSTS